MIARRTPRQRVATRNGQPAWLVAQRNGDERQRPAVTINQWRAARYGAPAPILSVSGLAERITRLIGKVA